MRPKRNAPEAILVTWGRSREKDAPRSRCLTGRVRVDRLSVSDAIQVYHRQRWTAPTWREWPSSLLRTASRREPNCGGTAVAIDRSTDWALKSPSGSVAIQTPLARSGGGVLVTPQARDYRAGKGSVAQEGREGEPGGGGGACVFLSLLPMYEFKRLGYSTYHDYLQSELWAGIRVKVLERDRRCVSCRRRSTQVHHKSYAYDAMAGVDLTKLVGICHKCHRAIHKGDPELKAANRRMRRRAKRKRIKVAGKSKKKRRRAVMCAECGKNRKWHGGPCPFCVKRLGLEAPA